MRPLAAAALAVIALLASSRPVREADQMSMAGQIFYAVEMLNGFENFQKLPTLPMEEERR